MLPLTKNVRQGFIISVFVCSCFLFLLFLFGCSFSYRDVPVLFLFMPRCVLKKRQTHPLHRFAKTRLYANPFFRTIL